MRKGELEVLAARYLTGERQVFETIYSAVRPRAKAYFSKVIAPAINAEDVEATFLAKLPEKLSHYERRDGCAFLTWMGKCMRRHAADYRRSKTKQLCCVSLDYLIEINKPLPPSLITSVEDEPEREPAERPPYHLTAEDYFLNLLTLEERNLIISRRRDRQSNGSIAANYRIREGTLRTRLSRAEAGLRRRMTEHNDFLDRLSDERHRYPDGQLPVWEYLGELSLLAGVEKNQALGPFGLAADSIVGRHTVGAIARLLRRIGASAEMAARLIRLTFAEEHGYPVLSSLSIAGRGEWHWPGPTCDSRLVDAENNYPPPLRNEIGEIRDCVAHEYKVLGKRGE